MEIQEIVSYYVYEDSNTIEVNFRLTTDSEDEIRTDIFSLKEAHNFGYDIFINPFGILLELDDDDDEFYEEDDFVNVDEDNLIGFINEYYIINPNKLPKVEFI